MHENKNPGFLAIFMNIEVKYTEISIINKIMMDFSFNK